MLLLARPAGQYFHPERKILIMFKSIENKQKASY
jgi:hypothetical protein